MRDLDAKIDRLARDLATLRAQVPVRLGVPESVLSLYELRVLGGNTLDATSGALGIKYSATKITTIPTPYDPEVDATLIDGVGYGELWIDGVYQSRVLIVNSAGYGTPINHALLAGIYTLTLRTTATLTVTTPAGTAAAYIVRPR